LDGYTWAAAPEFPAGTYRGLHWTGSTLVAVGDGGAIATSPDGYRWTARAASGDFQAAASCRPQQ
jgi:hypothetical protein